MKAAEGGFRLEQTRGENEKADRPQAPVADTSNRADAGETDSSRQPSSESRCSGVAEYGHGLNLSVVHVGCCS